MRCTDVILQKRIWSRGGGLVQSCDLPTGCAMHCCWAVCQMLSSLNQKQQLYHNPLTLPCSQSPHSLWDAPLRSFFLDYTHCCSLFPGRPLCFSAAEGSCVLRYLMYEAFRRKKRCLVLVFSWSIATMKWLNGETKQVSSILMHCGL